MSRQRILICFVKLSQLLHVEARKESSKRSHVADLADVFGILGPGAAVEHDVSYLPWTCFDFILVPRHSAKVSRAAALLAAFLRVNLPMAERDFSRSFPHLLGPEVTSLFPATTSTLSSDDG